MGPAQAFVLSRTGDTQPMGAQELCLTVWRYARRQYYELPANILEGITLVSHTHASRLCSAAAQAPPTPYAAWWLCAGAAGVCPGRGLQGECDHMCRAAVHQPGTPRLGLQGGSVQGGVCPLCVLCALPRCVLRTLSQPASSSTRPICCSQGSRTAERNRPAPGQSRHDMAA